MKDNDSSNELILLQEDWGGAAYLNNDWGDGSQEVYAIESVEEEGKDPYYLLAIKEKFTDYYSQEEKTDWQTVKVTSDGKLDWGESTFGGITKKEKIFNED